MASTALLTSLLLVLMCFVTYGNCADKPTVVDGTTTIDWKDKFDTKSNEGSNLEREYDSKGLQPWYDFANSFISTVLSKDPYGKFVHESK